MNPHLTKIEKAVKLACPEIMELKFGCRIKAHPSANDQMVYGILGKEGNFWNCLEQIDTKLGHAHLVKFGENAGFQILGQEIRLEHVLRALKYYHKNSRGFFINQYGIFYELEEAVFHPDHGMKPLVLRYKNLGWDLTQPLSGQSPETLEFIASLLPES